MEFTLENTKDATHYFLSRHGGVGQFGNRFGYINDKCDLMNTKLSPGEYMGGYDIDLTNQTNRGYPTLEHFLAQGYELEVGDKAIDVDGGQCAINPKSLGMWNSKSSAGNGRRYIKSLHDNRLDLTQLAKDEYYSKRDKEWPTNERIDNIGANGGDGLHYDKPVFTQEMADNGELPPVGSKYLDEDGQICVMTGVTLTLKVLGEMIEHPRINGLPALSCCEPGDIKPIDNRTDEEKAIDNLGDIADGQIPFRGYIIDAIKEGKIHGVKWEGK